MPLKYILFYTLNNILCYKCMLYICTFNSMLILQLILLLHFVYIIIYVHI